MSFSAIQRLSSIVFHWSFQVLKMLYYSCFESFKHLQNAFVDKSFCAISIHFMYDQISCNFPVKQYPHMSCCGISIQVIFDPLIFTNKLFYIMGLCIKMLLFVSEQLKRSSLYASMRISFLSAVLCGASC